MPLKLLEVTLREFGNFKTQLTLATMVIGFDKQSSVYHTLVH